MISPRLNVISVDICEQNGHFCLQNGHFDHSVVDDVGLEWEKMKGEWPAILLLFFAIFGGSKGEVPLWSTQKVQHRPPSTSREGTRVRSGHDPTRARLSCDRRAYPRI